MSDRIDVLKVFCGKWEKASRDKRELSACRELGYHVAVLAKGEKDDFGKKTVIEGFDAFLFTSMPLKHSKSKLLNRISSFVKWARFIKQLNPRVVSGHDIAGVMVAVVAKRMGFHGKIVYDSHEFELGRYARGIKTPYWLVKYIERICIKESVFTVVVNESIKKEIINIYAPRNPVIVVRSTPERWKIDEKICKDRREELLGLFPAEENITKLLMFHGLLGRGNGIEYVIPALRNLPGVGYILMGKKSMPDYYEELMNLAEECNVIRRVISIDPVPYEKIWEYVGAVDTEVMLIQGITKSYYYCLPNKLFESIQSLVPVVSSDIPEMKNIVETFDVGIVCNNCETQNIITVLNEALTDINARQNWKQNLCKAKDTLCWEYEKNILKEQYRRLFMEE